MEDELQTKLIEILSSIQSTAGKAGDFAMSQLPDIAQSYVVYGRAAHTIGLIAGLLILICTAYVMRRGWVSVEKSGDDFFPYFMGGMVASIVGVMVTAINAGPALLVWFAPKVWLLKQIAGLV